ncbi:MAG: lactonase family protein [Verrucomicrobiae bacterium]|nr:lactonase family protein [Verrucomicrobiae bacterium]
MTPRLHFLPFLLSLSLVAATAASAADPIVFFGTYTRGKAGSKGIYASRLNLETGELNEPVVVAEVENPSFLAIHPNRRFLYAVSEISGADGKPAGGVTAYRIESETGALTRINAQPSGGDGPCHVSIDPSGRCALVANYGSGVAAALKIGEDGALTFGNAIQHTGSSVDPRRQKGPHAHSANPSPDGRHAFVADLGLDKILIHRIDPATGTLAEHGFVKVEPGSGPRHLAVHPNGRWAYVINEMALTVTALNYDASGGSLAPFQTVSTLPDADRDQAGLSTAEIQVHPGGKFLYGSNRGHDTIAVFSIDPADGRLTRLENEPIRGQTPRNFALDPTGRYLLAEGQASNTVSVFRIDPETGRLEYTGHTIEVPSPVCAKFLATE